MELLVNYRVGDTRGIPTLESDAQVFAKLFRGKAKELNPLQDLRFGIIKKTETDERNFRPDEEIHEEIVETPPFSLQTLSEAQHAELDQMKKINHPLFDTPSSRSEKPLDQNQNSVLERTQVREHQIPEILPEPKAEKVKNWFGRFKGRLLDVFNKKTLVENNTLESPSETIPKTETPVPSWEVAAEKVRAEAAPIERDHQRAEHAASVKLNSSVKASAEKVTGFFARMEVSRKIKNAEKILDVQRIIQQQLATSKEENRNLFQGDARYVQRGSKPTREDEYDEAYEALSRSSVAVKTHEAIDALTARITELKAKL